MKNWFRKLRWGKRGETVGGKKKMTLGKGKTLEKATKTTDPASARTQKGPKTTNKKQQIGRSNSTGCHLKKGKKRKKRGHGMFDRQLKLPGKKSKEARSGGRGI